jgi:hypothetical protein
MAVGFTTTYAISAYHHSSTNKTDWHDIPVSEILLKKVLNTILYDTVSDVYIVYRS